LSQPIVTVFEAIHQDGLDALSEFSEVRIAIGASRDKQLMLASDSDVVILKSVVRIDGEFLDNAPRLRIIGRAGTGIDNIDLVEAKNRGIEVLTIPLGNTVTAAEFTILQMLFLCRRMTEVIDFITKRDYRRHLLEGRELSKLVVGIVGLGNVGMAVAERLIPFGCKVVAYDPASRHADKFGKMGGVSASSLEDLLPQVDVLSLHARLTSETWHLMGRESFSLLKKGVMLINTSRAALIDDEALIDAIESGVVASAALDVLEPEPPFDLAPAEHAYSHALLDQPHVFVTPHIGASTVDAQSEISLSLANKIRECFS